MAKNQITKADLALEMCSDNYAVGTYLHYVGCQDKELYRIVEQKSDKQLMIAQIDLATMSEILPDSQGRHQQTSLTGVASVGR